MNSLILLSLSRIEQKNLFQKIILQYWIDSQYKPLIALIDKLFLRTIERSLGPGEKLNNIKYLLDYKLTGAPINKASFFYIIDTLNQINNLKPFNGFRLIFMHTVNQSISISKKSNKLISEKPSHEGVFIGESPNFESTLANVLTWLLNQQSVAVAELRLKLLPLDLLPCAFISEINEKSLELTGELALEEVGNDAVISSDALNDVIANLQSIESDININIT